MCRISQPSMPQVQTQRLGRCCPRQPHTPGSLSERESSDWWGKQGPIWGKGDWEITFVGNSLKGYWSKSGTTRPAPSQQSKSKSKSNHHPLILMYFKNIYSGRWRDGSVCKALDVLDSIRLGWPQTSSEASTSRVLGLHVMTLHLAAPCIGFYDV